MLGGMLDLYMSEHVTTAFASIVSRLFLTFKLVFNVLWVNWKHVMLASRQVASL